MRPKTIPLALCLLLLAGIALLPRWTNNDRPAQTPLTRTPRAIVSPPIPAPTVTPGVDQSGKEDITMVAPPTSPHVMRARTVQLDVSALPVRTTPPGRQDGLTLFEDTALTVRWEKLADHGSKNYAWYGSLLEDRLSAVTLTRVGDYTIIDVQSPVFGQYEVRGQDGKAGEIRQFDSARINQGCKTSIITAGFGNAAPLDSTDELVTAPRPINPVFSESTIDVLMVYTTKARDLAGGRSAIVAKAQAAVNGENSNFNRSEIVHQMRLVQARETTHTASGSLPTELGWVAGNSTVASVRSEVGADVVAFLSDKDDSGVYGIAYQLTSTGGNSGQVFSANFYDTASGVWPHEVGHNLGCQHNSAGVYSYSSGHYWTNSSNGNTYGSLMSYIGTRVPYFSNPDVDHWTGTTGTSSRDNALSVNNIGDNVAGYKGSKILVEPSCAVTTSTTKPKEGVDFTLTLKTINGGPSTMTAGKITFTLPSRLTLVSHNGGGAFDATTKVWSIPSLADNASATLVLTVRPNVGSAGYSLAPSAKVSSVGTGVIDFDIYNNDSLVTVVPVTVPIPGLVLHYALDETSGKTAADGSDNSGTQNAVTTYASPLWQPGGGMIGGALRFTPTAQADVAQAFSYDRTTPIINDYPFTLALWSRAVPGTWYQVCAMLGDQTLGSSYYEIDLNTQRAQAIARNTAQVWATSPAGLAITDDAWHHLAAVYTSPTLRTLYVDGVAVATSTTSVPFVTNTTRFSIGALMRNSPTQAYAGDLDDIGLWNIALGKELLALIHAFGRHSQVDLDDPAITTLLAVNTSQSGFARAGDLVWVPATGLPGAIGSSGTRNGQTYLVLNTGGIGIVALTQPELLLQNPAGESVTLSWHSGFSDWILQDSTDLAATDWSDSTLPVDDDGLTRSVVVSTLDSERRFFRLKKP